MARIFLSCAGALLALSLPACERADRPARGPATTAPAGDIEAANKLLADVIAALNAKDWTKVKGLYAADAIMVTPASPPFKGAAAISAEYDRLAADPAVQFHGTAGAAEVGGDLAYADAAYQMTYTNPETNKVESGHGYCVWVFRKQPDGSWKIVRDVSAPVPPPAVG